MARPASRSAGPLGGLRRAGRAEGWVAATSGWDIWAVASAAGGVTSPAREQPASSRPISNSCDAPPGKRIETPLRGVSADLESARRLLILGLEGSSRRRAGGDLLSAGRCRGQCLSPAGLGGRHRLSAVGAEPVVRL